MCGDLDELYPSFPNIVALCLHGFLVILHTLFLVSLPFLIVLPIWTALLYIAAVLAITGLVGLVLNGRKDELHSKTDLGEDASRHPEECWIYLNGVSVGYMEPVLLTKASANNCIVNTGYRAISTAWH